MYRTCFGKAGASPDERNTNKGENAISGFKIFGACSPEAEHRVLCCNSASGGRFPLAPWRGKQNQNAEKGRHAGLPLRA